MSSQNYKCRFLAKHTYAITWYLTLVPKLSLVFTCVNPFISLHTSEWPYDQRLCYFPKDDLFWGHPVKIWSHLRHIKTHLKQDNFWQNLRCKKTAWNFFPTMVKTLWIMLVYNSFINFNKECSVESTLLSAKVQFAIFGLLTPRFRLPKIVLLFYMKKLDRIRI